jgi:UDP-N-acetylglucosamine diphosphorylase / glucose-1-phosphate thymidylyltransferase / UDP-N-acetylgalactosamine diphosphorylase / glucosamine-1-phosphate N-acetyltransferase / galactosamine-1-phosphate N-acetyltransferase
MQAVILAAGRGKRLGGITNKTQKCLVRVAGTPILERLLQTLPPVVHEVVLVVGYCAEKVRAYFGDEWDGKSIQYVEQDELLGSGDALHAAKHLLHNRFLVLNGDDLYQIKDLEQLLAHELAMLVYDYGKPVRTGKPVINEEGFLTAILPDSESQMVNTGAYVLDERFFDYPLERAGASNTELGLPHTIAAMAGTLPVKAVIATHWMSAGTPRAIAKARAYFEATEPERELFAGVEEALQEIRPMLALHQGGVQLLSVKDGIIKLKLKGACEGCPMSVVTFGVALKELLLERFPNKIKDVIY